jgi:hypothetical protein
MKKPQKRDSLPRAASMGALNSSYSSQAQAAALGLGAMAIRAVGIGGVLGVQKGSPEQTSYAAMVKNTSVDLERSLSQQSSMSNIVVQIYDVITLDNQQSSADASDLPISKSLFKPKQLQAFLNYRYRYSESLYFWGLLELRAEMLKFPTGSRNTELMESIHIGSIFGNIPYTEVLLNVHDYRSHDRLYELRTELADWCISREPILSSVF